MSVFRAAALLRLLITVFVLASSKVGLADAQQITRVPMVWNEASYTCVAGTFGQPDPRIPWWEQPIPIFLATRQIDDQYQATYTCTPDSSPAGVAPPPAGQALIESLVWNGQRFACTWVGQVQHGADEPGQMGPVNVTIRKSDGMIEDGYVCSQAGQ